MAGNLFTCSSWDIHCSFSGFAKLSMVRITSSSLLRQRFDAILHLVILLCLNALLGAFIGQKITFVGGCILSFICFSGSENHIYWTQAPSKFFLNPPRPRTLRKLNNAFYETQIYTGALVKTALAALCSIHTSWVCMPKVYCNKVYFVCML